MTMNDLRIARITGGCQFPLWLGDDPSFYDGPGFARHLFAIKNIAFARVLMDQGIYVTMLVSSPPRDCRQTFSMQRPSRRRSLACRDR